MAIKFIRDMDTGTYWIVNTDTGTALQTATDPSLGSHQAAQTLYGPAVAGAISPDGSLVAWEGGQSSFNNQGSASTYYNTATGASSDGMEQVISGQFADPLTGEFRSSPQTVTSGQGITYAPHTPRSAVRTPTPPPSQPSPGTVVTQTQPEVPVPETPGSTRDFFAEAQALFPWMPAQLLSVYATSWQETGDPAVALGTMRQSPIYDTFFPGNRRPDGSFRFDEQAYSRQIDAYGLAFSQFDIPADTFRHKYVDLLEGDVSPQELSQRLEGLYTNVVAAGPAIRNYYTETYGINGLSDASILASVLDDAETNPAVYERRFTVARVGGSGTTHGFDVRPDFAGRLVDYGFEQEAANRFFGQARQALPTIGTLLSRHNDPDDEFDLEEFADAIVFQDPKKARELSQLFSKESSLFNVGREARDGSGSFTGLRAV